MRAHLSVFLLACCACIMMIGVILGSVGPLLPTFARSEHSNFFAALVYAGHPIGSLLAGIPAVLVSRRFGLPRIIFIGALLMAASTILFTVPGHGYWIVLGRIGQGAGASLVWQSIFAWLISNVGPAHRATATGTLLASSTAGGLLAPEIGALTTITGRWILLIPAAFLLLGSLYFLKMPAYDFAPRSSLGDIKRAFSSRLGLAGLGISSGGALATVAFATTLPLYLGNFGLGAFAIGLILTIGSGLMIISNPLAGRIFDSGHKKLVLLGGYSLSIAGVLALALASGRILLAVLALFATVTLGLAMLPSGVLVSQLMHENRIDQTVSQGLSTTIWASSALVGSLASGLLPSPRFALYALASWLGVTLLVLMLGLNSRRRQRLATKA